MAEMLIDDAKFGTCNTAEADAIRAKTGGATISTSASSWYAARLSVQKEIYKYEF